MGLFTLLVGVRMALRGEELIMVLVSLALGAMLGEWINIEDRLERFGALAGNPPASDGAEPCKRLHQRQFTVLRGVHGHRWKYYGRS